MKECLIGMRYNTIWFNYDLVTDPFGKGIFPGIKCSYFRNDFSLPLLLTLQRAYRGRLS